MRVARYSGSDGSASWRHLANTMERCCCLQEQLVQMRMYSASKSRCRPQLALSWAACSVDGGHVGANWQIRWNGLVFYRNSWCRLQLRRRRLAHSSTVHSSAASEPVCASPMRPLATITLTTCRCLLQEQLVGADAQRGTASERVIVVHDWLTRQ